MLLDLEIIDLKFEKFLGDNLIHVISQVQLKLN